MIADSALHQQPGVQLPLSLSSHGANRQFRLKSRPRRGLGRGRNGDELPWGERSILPTSLGTDQRAPGDMAARTGAAKPETTYAPRPPLRQKGLRELVRIALLSGVQTKTLTPITGDTRQRLNQIRDRRC